MNNYEIIILDEVLFRITKFIFFLSFLILCEFMEETKIKFFNNILWVDK